MKQVVIVDAIRTPVGRRRGTLAGRHPVDLLGYTLKELLNRNAIDATVVDDVIVGCVSQVGEQAVNVGRNAWLSAGLPESVPATTVDRQCGSSLQALTFAAQGVLSGMYDAAIAAGVESMTRIPLGSTFGHTASGGPKTNALAERYQLDAPWFDQALGAEMIAREYGFTREELDRYSLRSHHLANVARHDGLFAAETIPVPVEPEAGGWFREDEGIRPDTSLEKLGALKPAFDGLALITAGNASQISDGASATLVMSEEKCRQLGLRPRARLVSFAVVGVDPVTMLKGPIPATGKVLERVGLRPEDIDLFEINEAFAPVVLAWQKEWKVPWDRVNVKGGAIALGHPLGATGTRITATMLNTLEQQQKRYGLIAICEGGGMANALIMERIP